MPKGSLYAAHRAAGAGFAINDISIVYRTKSIK